MTAAVRTASGTYVVDVEAEEVIGAGDDFESPRIAVELPRVVAAAAAGLLQRAFLVGQSTQHRRD